jgi:hypothetical protein
MMAGTDPRDRPEDFGPAMTRGGRAIARSHA